MQIPQKLAARLKFVLKFNKNYNSKTFQSLGYENNIQLTFELTLGSITYQHICITVISSRVVSIMQNIHKWSKFQCLKIIIKKHICHILSLRIHIFEDLFVVMTYSITMHMNT